MCPVLCFFFGFLSFKVPTLLKKKCFMISTTLLSVGQEKPNSYLDKWWHGIIRSSSVIPLLYTILNYLFSILASVVIMSDEGDRACPLCAEEMDLTDQQLKPCKCGYEICVWCWHHIMDMAEKDHLQGRCPACRTPYNKEKIVGTTANCERLMAVMNMEKKMKSQKTKSKISDGRKQLGSVRVVQKSLVYIVGLPLTLADENLLQQRDYFGQYGKVLKVSISRTAAGSVQQFANGTCSVYITYTKEEEAVRCIQSVHGFVLDGRPLRACFGTTKYCHAWLRNVPCSNPDCLYLHEFGTQEDSFTKDEIISAYTRNRVLQITGAPGNMQRRSGNILPPPAVECHISSSTFTEKPISKSASKNVATSFNGSLPNSNSARSAALPSAASWGARALNGSPPACSNGPSKQKPEICSNSAAFATAVATTVQVPRLPAETRKKLMDNEESHNIPHKGGLEPLKSSSRQYSCTDSDTAHEASVHIHSPPSSKDKGRFTSTPFTETTSMEFARRSCSPGSENTPKISTLENNDNLCSGIESLNVTTHLGEDHSGNKRPNSSLFGNIENSSVNRELQKCFPEDFREPSTRIALGKTVASTDDYWGPKAQSGLRTGFLTRRQSEMESHLPTVSEKSDSQVASSRVMQHLETLEGRMLNDSEFVTSTSYFSTPSPSLHHYNLSSVHSPTRTEPNCSSSFIQDPPILDNNVNNSLLLRPSGISAVLNGYPEDIVNSYVESDWNFEHACLKNKLVARSEVEAVNAEQSVATDVGESSVISNILSLDFDPWEESLTSQNLVRLLGEGDNQPGPLAPSNSQKAQNSNKSRFSFARLDECMDLPSKVEPSFGHMQQVFKEDPLSHDFAVNRDVNFRKFGDCNGFSTFNTEEPDNLAGNYSFLSSNKFSGSKSQVSAPPGFSTPNKAPPPGFISHERMGGNFDAVSVAGNHFLDSSSLLRNPYHSPQTVNIGSGTDIEFMDPAILAVGKGRLPTGLNYGVGLDMRYDFSPRLNAVENEARFQSLVHRSSPPVQNLRISGTGNGHGPISDALNHFPSRIMEQTLASNVSTFSPLSLQQARNSMMPNGQWNNWSEGNSASDTGFAELLRIESLGFNNFYGGYEESKFHMPSSGDIYNRTYGI